MLQEGEKGAMLYLSLNPALYSDYDNGSGERE